MALEIDNNHVHLFVNTPPTIAPHQIMFRLKGYTSRVLRSQFPHLMKLPSMWTRSYYCGTAGEMSATTIKKYIANHNEVSPFEDKYPLGQNITVLKSATATSNG